MSDIQSLISSLKKGDHKALARSITIVENELPSHDMLLESLTINDIPLIGITGPPGSGKSSLVNALVSRLLIEGKRIGVIAVDPTSPFNFGSLLGDRIRLAGHFADSNLYIRSVATRGSLGGLSEKITEITDVMKAAAFDFLFVETVGVGQSEVEIAGLADSTVVVLNPESGDEIQTMKAGLMEIADIFVVNKSDHSNTDWFAKNLLLLTAQMKQKDWQTPVIKTVAITGEGIDELLLQIEKHGEAKVRNDRKAFLLADKVRKIIEKQRMKDFDRDKTLELLRAEMKKGEVNVYQLAKRFG